MDKNGFSFAKVTVIFEVFNSPTFHTVGSRVWISGSNSGPPRPKNTWS